MADKKQQSILPAAHQEGMANYYARTDGAGKWFLALFWSFALIAIIIGDYAGTNNINLIRAVVAIFIGIVFYIIFLIFIHRLNKAKLIITCFLVIFILGFGTLVVAGDLLITTTTLFLMFITTISSVLSCLALYYERFNGENIPQWQLVHNRYLEYLKQAIWLMGFIVVGYVAWSIQRSLLHIAALSQTQTLTENVTQKSINAAQQLSINQVLTYVTLLQMAIVIMGAVLVMTYAVNMKLEQIEHQKSGASNRN